MVYYRYNIVLNLDNPKYVYEIDQKLYKCECREKARLPFQAGGKSMKLDLINQWEIISGNFSLFEVAKKPTKVEPEEEEKDDFKDVDDNDFEDEDDTEEDFDSDDDGGVDFDEGG